MSLNQILFDLSCGVAGYFALGVIEAVGAGLWWVWCLFMNQRNHGCGGPVVDA